jgi:hypothetical protein
VRKEVLLVEVGRVNLCAETKDHLPSPTPILAVKNPKGLTSFDVQEEVYQLHLAMIHIEKNGKRKVLAQHALPLYNGYRISR